MRIGAERAKRIKTNISSAPPGQEREPDRCEPGVLALASLGERVALTLNEFVELVGISRTTAYRRIAAGDIRTVRFGQRQMIPVGEVRRIFGPVA